jgi:hypothetical protein
MRRHLKQGAIIRAAHVRFGSKADIGLVPVDVRFTPKADIAEYDWDVRFVPLTDISSGERLSRMHAEIQ